MNTTIPHATNVTTLPAEPPPLVLAGLVYLADLCKWLNKSPVTMWRWIKSGYLPKPANLGQCYVWPSNQIAAWAEEKGLVFVPASGGIRHTCK